ncbi:hypothetical protein AMS68_007298 [Peltaster fructicola]|uniref:Ubiquitin-like protease family profile domain-containing protein n=1 Tax=Peltaster fructicola TaxID=286661 RepID=A0A6H0Y4D7_9PEZI|nr:hypothetical protein AMS68_007298 [Peltaster fructicola]
MSFTRFFAPFAHKSTLSGPADVRDQKGRRVADDIQSVEDENTTARIDLDGDDRHSTPDIIQIDSPAKHRTNAPFAQRSAVDTPRRADAHESRLTQSKTRPAGLVKPGASNFRPTYTLNRAKPGVVPGTKRAYPQDRAESAIEVHNRSQSTNASHQKTMSSRISDSFERLTTSAFSQVQSTVVNRPNAQKRRRSSRAEGKDLPQIALADGLVDITEETIAAKRRKKNNHDETCKQKLDNVKKARYLEHESEDELAGETTIRSRVLGSSRKSEQLRIPLKAFVGAGLKTRGGNIELIWNHEEREFELCAANRQQRVAGKQQLVSLGPEDVASWLGIKAQKLLHIATTDPDLSQVFMQFKDSEGLQTCCSRLELKSTQQEDYPQESVQAAFENLWAQQGRGSRSGPQAQRDVGVDDDHPQQSRHFTLQQSERTSVRNGQEITRRERHRDRMQTESRNRGPQTPPDAQTSPRSNTLNGQSLRSIKQAAQRTLEATQSQSGRFSKQPKTLPFQEESSDENKDTNVIPAQTTSMSRGKVSNRDGQDSIPHSKAATEDTPRRSQRNPRSTAQRKLTPPPVLRWTHVNRPAPWSQAVVYPSEGVRRVTVEFQDLERLDEGEFLNDTLISFGLRRVEETMPEALRKHTHWFNSYFYSTLCSGQGLKGFNYDAVKRWTKNVDLLSTDYIVVPINHDLHWFAAIILNLPTLDPDTRSSSPMLLDDVQSTRQKLDDLSLHEDEPSMIEVPDSQETLPTAAAQPSRKTASKSRKLSRLPPKANPTAPTILTLDSFSTPHGNEISVLKQYVCAELQDKREISIDREDIKGVNSKGLPQQDNFCDCGLYVIAYLERFARNPRGFVDKLLSRSLDWTTDFEDFHPSKKRAELRDDLLALYAQQEQQRAEKKLARSAAKRAKASPGKHSASSNELEAEPARPYVS